MAKQEPTHHPDESALMQHASGQLDVSSRVLIEAHLAFCDRCSATLASLTEPGRAWLEEQPTVAPKPSIWTALDLELDAEMASPNTGLEDVPLPTGARSELPEPLEGSPRWRRIPLSRARFALLHREPQTKSFLAAVRIPGGLRFPRHEHLGAEDVVVLTGAFRDAQGHFGPGDFQHNQHGTRHEPVVDEGEPCWIVARYENGIRFFGLRGLMLKYAGG